MLNKSEGKLEVFRFECVVSCLFLHEFVPLERVRIFCKFLSRCFDPKNNLEVCFTHIQNIICIYIYVDDSEIQQKRVDIIENLTMFFLCDKVSNHSPVN